MSGELWKMTAVEAVARLKKREITPLELIDAAEKGETGKGSGGHH